MMPTAKALEDRGAAWHQASQMPPYSEIPFSACRWAALSELKIGNS